MAWALKRAPGPVQHPADRHPARLQLQGSRDVLAGAEALAAPLFDEVDGGSVILCGEHALAAAILVVALRHDVALQRLHLPESCPDSFLRRPVAPHVADLIANTV